MRWFQLGLSVLSAVGFAATTADARSLTPPSNQVMLCGTASGCNGCHRPDPVPTSNAAVTVSVTAPVASSFPPLSGYLPATRYSLLMRVAESALNPRCAHGARTSSGGCPEAADTCRFGFQMTAVPLLSCAGTPTPAGCFLATTPDVQVAGGPCGVGLEFAEHNGMAPGCGIVPTTVLPTSQERVWAFDWLAPLAGTGPVRFHWAVNSANSNETNQNDTIYFGQAVWDEAVSATCALLFASAPLSPPPDKTGVLFADATSCMPKLVPPGVLVPMFTGTPVQNVDLLDATPSLTVYEVACPCTGTLHLRKNGVNVEAQWL